MVSGEAGGAVRCGQGFAWPAYLSWIRTSPNGGSCAADRAGTVLLLYVASLCDRSKGRLFEGDSDAGGVQAGEECEGYVADGDGVGLRQDSERPEAGGVPHE